MPYNVHQLQSIKVIVNQQVKAVGTLQFSVCLCFCGLVERGNTVCNVVGEMSV